MKELGAPHNDWWRPDRELPLGGRRLEGALATIAEGFVSAERFAASVRAGLGKLEASSRFRAARESRSLQEQLRPLFCPVEINLASDVTPLDEAKTATSVPSALLVDERLAAGRLETSRAHYQAALEETRSRFPETDRRDADHAWLGPVVAASSRLAVQALIDAGVVDAELVSDVLAVDFTNPALSASRCRLLPLVPERVSTDWRRLFQDALASSSDPAAKQLLANLTDPDRNEAAHRRRASETLAACRTKLEARSSVVSMLRLLAQRRAEIGTNEISSNPRGRILEPGFRVIFPERGAAPAPDTLRLTESCDVVN
jgi:hypothetical protein